MSKIRLNSDDIKWLTLFENLTNTRPRDCIYNEKVACFIVGEGETGKAIGKNGAKIKKVKEKLSRHVMVVEYSQDEKKFIKNLFHPVEIQKLKITTDDENQPSATIQVSLKDRGRVIGEDGYRIKMARELALRHHNIQNITLQVA